MKRDAHGFRAVMVRKRSTVDAGGHAGFVIIDRISHEQLPGCIQELGVSDGKVVEREVTLVLVVDCEDLF